MSNPSDDSSRKLIPSPVGGLPMDTRIQDYRIKGVVGEGGFAIVYLAEDVMLHREIAIKEYMPASLAVRNDRWGVEPRSADHSDTFAKGMRSFINEARLLARFKHTALVDVLRFWEENGTAYMAMPYYRGKTLREVIRQAGFRCDEAWLHRLLEPLLGGLQAMHKENCFHRDISTDNIMMLNDGNPVLLDFGAARRIVAEPDQLATVILKPGFAPIEQYSDDITTAPQGPWTDIYALCAVCYLAISGRMPTTSVARIMRDPVIPLASMEIAGFSPRFLTAIDKGLAVRPEDRPQTLDEFRALLNQPASPVVKPVPVEAAAVTPPPPVIPAVTLPKEPEKKATPAIPPIPAKKKDKEKEKSETKKPAGKDLLGEETIIPGIKPVPVLPAASDKPRPPPVDKVNLQAPSSTEGNAKRAAGIAVILVGVCILAVAAYWALAPKKVGDDIAKAKLDIEQPVPPKPQPEPVPPKPQPEPVPPKPQPEPVPKEPPKTSPPAVIDPPPPQGSRQGNVILNIRPWGKVIVDGRLRGNSPPLKSLQLPVGRHKLVLKHPLGTDYFTEILVTESRAVEISHDFAAKPNE